MKKILVLSLMSLLISLTAFGCGSSTQDKEGTETTEGKNSAETEDEGSTTESPVNIDTDAALDFDPSKYVTLGEYENLEVDYIIPSVTDEDVEDEASCLVDDNITYQTVDEPAASGKQVTITYKGTIDGKEFDGGSDEDYSFVLGQGEFLDDFEQGVIGLKAGESNTFTFTFPEDYYEELAGKEVTFEVSVSDVSNVIVPEYNDELVASATEYKTVEEYEASLKETLMEEAKKSSEEQAGEELINKALSNCTFSTYPEDLVSACYTSTYATYESYAEMFGMDMDEFVESFLSDNDSGILDEATKWAKEIIFLKAIGEVYGFDYDSEYDEKINTYMEDYGYSTVEEFENDYGVFDTYVNIMRDTVIDKLMETAVLHEVTEEEYDAENEEYEDEEYVEDESAEDESDDDVEVVEEE